MKPSGESLGFNARAVVVNMGGSPLAPDRLESPLKEIISRCRERVCQASDFIDTRREPPASVVEGIRNGGGAVIVGGSHTAWSVAATLLQDPAFRGPSGEPPSVTIVHRSDIRLFYMSRESARRDGYTFDALEDVCSLTGRVNRFGGLRGDAHALARRALGIANRPSPVRLVRLDSGAAAVKDCLLTAGAVILATGYTARFPRIVGADGEVLRPAVSDTGTVVDSHGRVYSDRGTAIPGVFAYGLGAGLNSGGSVGGERRYSRRADGVWLYQHDIGGRVLDALAILAPRTNG